MRLRIIVLALAFAWASTSEAQVDSCHYNPDVDHDGLVTVVDLMGLLSFFGSADPDLDCWFGPEDDCFGVVDACGVCGGDGVDADADGVCDDVDDCVGALDVCGICNGPGPVVPVVDSVIVTMDSVYFEEMDFWFVYQTDVDTLFSLTCPTPGCTDPAAWNFNPSANWEDGSCLDGPLQCGEVTSVNYHGHEYPVVAIGDQCWFAENLRTHQFRNGDPIHEMDSTEALTTVGQPTRLAFNFDDAWAAERGYLYNGLAVKDERELCPLGWRIPTDAEFLALEGAAGMTDSVQQLTSWRGTDEAFRLKASASDPIPWNGDNALGFNAIPTGVAHPSFSSASNATYWMRDGLSWNMDLYFRGIGDGGGVYRLTHPSYAARAIRCMRTEEDLGCWDPDGDGICPEDEISGCLEPGAWNYNPDATANAFNCTYGPPECGDVSTLTYQGHAYELVAIGGQCWFAENLQAEHYLNGDSIPTGISDEDWFGLGHGGQLTLDHYPANVATYGRLYNWHAVQDSRGLCPEGWQVPSDGEWTAMELSLGLDSMLADSMGWRGTDHGNQLKMQSEDYPAWGGSNSSGFGALPGARVASGGGFGLYGYGLWWTATEYQPGAAWSRIMFNLDNVNRDFGSKGAGLSIRCMRVAEESCWDPDADGICAEDEISGCMDASSANFNPAATEDDGTCTASACGDMESIHFDGHEYAVVGVGAQCWFAENLRSWHYANGDSISVPGSGEEWMAAEEGVVGTYADGTVNCAHFCWPDSAASLFGNLYSGYAVTDERNLCPNGWHAPSNDEWLQLEQFTAAYVGDSVSFALRADFLWDNPVAGSDVWGMALLPAGVRDIWTGGPEAMLDANAATQGQFWTTSIHPGDEELGWHRYYHHNTPEPSVGVPSRKEGKSVRCLKD